MIVSFIYRRTSSCTCGCQWVTFQTRYFGKQRQVSHASALMVTSMHLDSLLYAVWRQHNCMWHGPGSALFSIWLCAFCSPVDLGLQAIPRDVKNTIIMHNLDLIQKALGNKGLPLNACLEKIFNSSMQHVAFTLSHDVDFAFFHLSPVNEKGKNS